jgi:hypothetical protein
MALKVCVGLSRKIGQPDFGSLGASCSVEAEVENSVLDREPEFSRRVRELYATCAQAVDEELVRQQDMTPSTRSKRRRSQNRGQEANGEHQNGKGSYANWPAMPSQVRALHVLAERHHLDLAELLATRFGVNSPEQLTAAASGRLIVELQGASGTRQ